MTNHPMERRRHKRHVMDVVLDVYAKGRMVSRARGLMSDLSLGGAKVETLADYQRGDTLVLELDRPGGKPLVLRGVIQHVEQGGRLSAYGVKFTSLGLFGRFKVSTFIKATVAKRPR